MSLAASLVASLPACSLLARPCNPHTTLTRPPPVVWPPVSCAAILWSGPAVHCRTQSPTRRPYAEPPQRVVVPRDRGPGWAHFAVRGLPRAPATPRYAQQGRNNTPSSRPRTPPPSSPLPKFVCEATKCGPCWIRICGPTWICEPSWICSPSRRSLLRPYRPYKNPVRPSPAQAGPMPASLHASAKLWRRVHWNPIDDSSAASTSRGGPTTTSGSPLADGVSMPRKPTRPLS